MAEKTISDNPKITDTVRFYMPTPDADGCFTDNPYKVNKVTIYYVERNFLASKYGEVDEVVQDEETLAELAEAQAEACVNPTAENIQNAQRLSDELDSKSQSTSIFFKEAMPVYTLGTEAYPAWLSTVPEESILTFSQDEDGNDEIGQFELLWSPQDSAAREGNYFICWTWQPLTVGETLSAHLPFSLNGDTRAVTAIPTHHTPEKKYETLLERYLPEMYKTLIATEDKTPQTLNKFNKAVADGFTFVEDYANQIIDLLDANVLHESLLVFLGNMFNLKLRSTDPTLWRRQIKKAIPTFKKKGTEAGLREAFAQAGMTLNKVTRFWQVISKYTHEESFKVKTSPTFQLKECGVLPVNPLNFTLWLRRANTEEYIEIPIDNVEFSTNEDTCETFITWVGDEKSAGALNIYEGDFIRILYQFQEITDDVEQQLEYYLRSLPLMDQRDEADQDYPPKNWNVHLLEEDDALFDMLIAVKHPYHDPIVFGQVRTEFPWSENIYNMEEYNGSIRDSNNPCDIDKNFVDPCGACASSNFSVDIGIEELSNNRILEAQDILSEYKPFHAVIHSLNVSGEIEDIILPPVETIEMLMTFVKVDNILPGNANPFFNRAMKNGLTIARIERDDLAEENTVLTGETGTAYHNEVCFVAVNQDLQSLGVITGSNILEVLAPSANAGTYMISQTDGQTARVASEVNEPVNTSMFTFNLKNVIFGSTSTITQQNVYKLSDETLDFSELGVKSQWDVDHTPDYDGGPWKVDFADYGIYEIENVLSDGTLILVDDGSLPTSDTSDLVFELLDDTDSPIGESETGELTVLKQASVDLNASGLTEDNLSQFMRLGDFVHYDGDEYEIVGFDGVDLLIGDYDSGDATGVDIEVRRLLASERYGYFGYRGLRLETNTDLESSLDIVNGSNPPSGDFQDNSNFKQNYLISIDDEFFRIEEIDGTHLVLGGPEQSWTTLAAGGEAVSFDVIHLEKTGVEVGFWAFDHIDRDGQDAVERRIESTVDDNVAVTILSSPGSSVLENVNQEESVSFEIEYIDGSFEEGTL